MKTPFILIITLTIMGCQNYECPSFDLRHPINRWNWFPENFEAYHFTNSNFDTLVLTKNKYEITPTREFKCHMCGCFQDLTSYYNIITNNIQFKCDLSYRGGGDDDIKDEGSLYFGIDKIGSPFNPSGQSVVESEISPYELKEFDIIYSDTLKLANQEFYNVTELNIKDTTKTKIHKIWIAPNKGMIGFKFNQQEWIKK
jgi:hypothetical protein